MGVHFPDYGWDNYPTRPAEERAAEVYPCQDDPVRWRVRFELFPEFSRPSSGWYGGRILWQAFPDVATYEEAEAAADRWRRDGVLPNQTEV